ncbi:MAG: DUF1273 family protein [Clostridia bacterium]|nr:DUF1273 family protein [Clostridia bacterium]
MARENTCCFTGHRFVGKDLSIDLLRRGIEYLIDNGVDVFIAGGALGFDTICAGEVLLMKEKYPHIKLHIYAPCNNQDANWSKKDCDIYKEILKRADLVDMPDFSYYDGCMKKRNYKMVDSSAYCIAYLNNTVRSGTAQTVRYAKSKGLNVYNLAGKK